MGTGSLLNSDAQVRLTGRLRRLPPGLILRVLQAVSLWTLIRAAFRAALNYTLGFRHDFAVTLDGDHLVMDHERKLLGFSFRSARSVLPLRRVVEITLEKGGEPASFSFGLGALALGTFIGFALLSEGLQAPSGAPWLLGFGALSVALGVGLDFFVGSGRSPRGVSGPPEIRLVLAQGRGYVLSRVDLGDAEAFLRAVETALTQTEGSLPSEAHRPAAARGQAAPLEPVTAEEATPPG